MRFLILIISSLLFSTTYADISPYGEEKITDVISEDRLDIDIEYPQFGIESIDTILKSFAEEGRDIFYADAKDLLSQDEDEEPLPDYYQMLFSLEYDIVHYDDHILAVRFLSYTYTGGAHGIPAVHTFNFNLKTGEEITLKNEKVLKKIQDRMYEATKDFLFEDGYGDDDWIKTGTEPDFINYGSFAIKTTSQGKLESITFYFQPYQVAAYAAGVLSATLKRDGSVEINHY